VEVGGWSEPAERKRYQSSDHQALLVSSKCKENYLNDDSKNTVPLLCLQAPGDSLIFNPRERPHHDAITSTPVAP
jgi:hypothetical protein